MDKIIKNIIEKIYLKGEENKATDKESVKKMKADLKKILGEIKDISVDYKICKDEEYRKIKYGKNCAVALDIIMTIAGSKKRLIIQVSKLGNFAQFYWEKELWGGMQFSFEQPEDWPLDLFNQIKKCIESYGIKFLTERELAGKFEDIPNYFDDSVKATVSDLIFCYDGSH